MFHLLTYYDMDLLKAIQSNPVARINNVFSVYNQKLTPDNIASFNLPVGITCPFAGECKTYCFGKRGNFMYPGVKKNHKGNYKLSLSEQFVNDVNLSIKALPFTRFFRIHGVGDYYSKTYAKTWISIATMNEDKIFYSYTKSMIFFQGLSLPDNFHLIQSEGTFEDKTLIDYSKPFVRLFNNREQIAQAVATGKFIDASISDLEALKALALNKNIALLKK